MKFAYADPPYPGCAKRHYACPEVDHRELITRLVGEFDAWALSTNSTALRDLLPICPPHVRIAAWVKPFAVFRPGVNPAYAWEPVIYCPRAGKRSREEATVRDFMVANITMRRGVHGAKPDAVCFWLFDLLGAKPDDEFHDLYIGSGAVSRAWDTWRIGLGAM
jgi:hypothetical protein